MNIKRVEEGNAECSERAMVVPARLTVNEALRV
jgi:hypothetical protein